MLEFTLRRIVATIPVLLGILIVAFTVLYLIPGDPAQTLAGPRADPETLARIRSEMGLDQPLLPGLPLICGASRRATWVIQ